MHCSSAVTHPRDKQDQLKKQGNVNCIVLSSLITHLGDPPGRNTPRHQFWCCVFAAPILTSPTANELMSVNIDTVQRMRTLKPGSGKRLTSLWVLVPNECFVMFSSRADDTG